MSRGSFWPSPSMVAMTGLVAARMPERSAALCPLRLVVAQIAQAGEVAAIDQRLDLGRRRVVAGVVDDDQLGEPRRRHGRIRLLDEAPDIAGLVERRNDDGDAHQVPLSRRLAATPLDTP